MAKRGNIFDPGYAPYGRYAGPAGDPEQWRDAFRARFSQAQIEEILQDDSPWAILGVSATDSFEVIKRAYRALVMKAHPDQGGSEAEFIRIQAAYEKICP